MITPIFSPKKAMNLYHHTHTKSQTSKQDTLSGKDCVSTSFALGNTGKFKSKSGGEKHTLHFDSPFVIFSLS